MLYHCCRSRLLFMTTTDQISIRPQRTHVLYSYIFYPSPLHVRLHSLHVTLIPSVGRPTTYKLAVICHSSLWRGLRLINACGGAICAPPLLNNFIHSFLGPNHARGCKVVSRRPHLHVAGDRPSPTPSITNLQPWTFTMSLRVRIRKRVEATPTKLS